MEIFFLPIAYLIGSLSSAILICKLLRLPDPRTKGSGNPGATNVLRIAGKKTAAAVLLLDALKGFLPVYFASTTLHFNLLWQGFVALAAVIGHIYPVFFGFKGGKGVATFLGGILALSWPLGVMLLAIWLVMAKLFHYSSLAALTMAVLSPFLGLLFYRPVVVVPIFLMAFLLVYHHRSNIMRIATGKESKIGSKS